MADLFAFGLTAALAIMGPIEAIDQEGGDDEQKPYAGAQPGPVSGGNVQGASIHAGDKIRQYK